MKTTWEGGHWVAMQRIGERLFIAEAETEIGAELACIELIVEWRIRTASDVWEESRRSGATATSGGPRSTAWMRPAQLVKLH